MLLLAPILVLLDLPVLLDMFLFMVAPILVLLDLPVLLDMFLFMVVYFLTRGLPQREWEQGKLMQYGKFYQ